MVPPRYSYKVLEELLPYAGILMRDPNKGYVARVNLVTCDSGRIYRAPGQHATKDFLARRAIQRASGAGVRPLGAAIGASEMSYLTPRITLTTCSLGSIGPNVHRIMS